MTGQIKAEFKPSSWFVSLWIAALLSVVGLPALAFEPTSMDLDQGWQYRWGDSPFEKGVPLWSVEPNSQEWKSIGFPSNPPERNNQNNVWYRITLPDQPDLGTSLYVFSIDLIAEVYFEGKRIYQFGTFNLDGSGAFAGWPWHIISLPRDYPGKQLYFRIYSDYPDIGLWGKIVLGNEGAHIQKIIQGDLVAVSVGLFFVFFGVLLLGLSLYRLSVPVLLMGLFWVNLGLIPIDNSHLKQLILFAPLGWQYAGAINYFLLPVSMAGLVQSMYGKGLWSINQRVWQIHLSFLAGAMVASFAGWVNLSSTYVYFDGLALVTLAGLTASQHFQAKKGSSNQKILAFGFWVMYLILIYNGLIAHDFLPFAPSSEYLGPLFLAFCFGLIMLREYNELKARLVSRTKELVELNQTLESKIEDRTKELQLSNQTKDEFFAIIAHDLKGPVGSLSTLLSHFQTSGQTLDPLTLGKMCQSSSKIYELLENLLAWARSQKGELSANPKNFCLNETVNSAMKLSEQLALDKNIPLSFESDARVYGYGDTSMIESVIRNLIHNAIKFSSAGEAITVTLDQTIDTLFLTVTDQGLGMSAEQLEDMFKVRRSTQLSTFGTNGESGTGLGLLLCKEFIQLNRGEISVTSTLGTGTAFTISIPVGEENSEKISNPRFDPRAWLKGARVLLVEDNAIHQQAAIETLSPFQVNLTLAKGSEEATQLFIEQSFDLVLMDVSLPGENGVVCSKKLKQLNKDLPALVALSSFSQGELEKQFDTLYFDGYLSKPLVSRDLEELLAGLSARLGNSNS